MIYLIYINYVICYTGCNVLTMVKPVEQVNDVIQILMKGQILTKH